MNYLAHSLAAVFDDDDLAVWRVAGTSLPDWLRVIDKRARLRPEVLELANVDDDRHRALRDGAQRHHDDDLRFHTLDAFETENHAVTLELRARDPNCRASTLGHVMVELLLDAALMERHPTLLARYYAAVDAIDEGVVAAFVRSACARPVEHAEIFLDRFRRARFLGAYADDDGLLDCLRGVWKRAGLGAIDVAVRDVIRDARPRVRALVPLVFPEPPTGPIGALPAGGA